ncbi:MAG: tetratricopeptide repeat protein [Acidobacteriota bacterium]
MKRSVGSALLALALGLPAPAALAGERAPALPESPAASSLVELADSLDRGDLDRAIRAGERAIEADPRNSVAHDLLGRAYGLKAKDSQLLEQVHLARRARSFFEKAVELDPDNVSARADLATYDMRAPAFLGGGMGKARRQAEEVLGRDAARGHELLGELAEREKNPVAAEAEYRRAVETSPRGSLRARRALSAFLVRKGRFAEARRLWLDVLEAEPTAAGYELAGIALASRADLEGAARDLEACLAACPGSSDPSRGEMLERLARLEEGLGRSGRARVALEEALRLEPHRTSWRRTLARLPR